MAVLWDSDEVLHPGEAQRPLPDQLAGEFNAVTAARK